jgi:hypothetical protein
MATFTLGLTSGPVTGSKNYTLSDADVDRWIAALRVVYKLPSATKAQVLGHWADDVMARQKSMVRRVERDAAEKAARAAVTDIGVS